MKIKCKINGVSSDFSNLPFGRQIDYWKIIKSFQEKAKSTWLSKKHRSHKAALAEFKKVYSPKEYFCKINADKDYYDDSFEVWYV